MLRDRIKRAMGRFTDRSQEEKIIFDDDQIVDVQAVEVKPPVSECRDLMIWNDPEHNTLGASAAYRLAEAELEQVEAKLKQVNKSILRMEQDLETKFSDDVKKLRDLQNELEVLFNEKILAQQMQSEEGDEDEFGDPDNEALNLSDDELADLENTMAEIEKIREHNKSFEKNRAQRRKEAHEQKERAEKIKKLYRKIAMKTHADRTTDNRLHQLWQLAKEAYENNDLEALELIEKEISLSGAGLFQSLMKRAALIHEKIAEVYKQLTNVYKTEEYQMWLDYRNVETRGPVEAHFSKKLDAEIKATIQAIRSIDPERYKPPPALSHDKFKVNTKTVMDETNGDELESPWSE